MTTTPRKSKADKRRERQEVAHEEHQRTQSPVKPKTPGQTRYWASLKANVMTVALGPAGTGKTFLAASLAAQMFKAGQIEQIILVRPAVEAGGEKHGFLPGDINAKLAPWAEPIIAILRKRLGDAAIKLMIQHRKLRIEPFTYMRGLTFDNAFVILDEAQNTTVEQMKLFTTRIGENTKVVIDGDIEQTDLAICNGLQAVIDIAHREHMDDVGVVRLTDRDIVRSAMTAKWVKGWKAFEAPAASPPAASNDHGKLPDLPFMGASAVTGAITG